MSEADRRSAIVEAVRALDAKGFNHGSSGNVSARCDGGLLVTPTGARAATLTPEALVRMDFGGKVDGAGTPSSEWRFHAEILRLRPEIEAVVHTHADACVALSCLRKPIPAFHYMVASFGGNTVPCARYEPFGSDLLAEAAVEALEGRFACLLANHGMIAIGRSLSHAVDLTVKLETLARQYILARQAGEPVLLEDADMAEVHERYRHYGVSAMPR
ncbi:class II aldolase/adducin family protein [Jiella pelagia]|uniref:Class II aldolase/adducin family protein n=1 Tax=Jiella pelagia TaxID=2986949 RepID=A0ABY7BWZ9_9HYPH|nr:class II aldolase/adducin family protein [Jiella pelagia]WAP67620.1 class II aldolase/adducin family protein [Jiella pelagia]